MPRRPRAELIGIALLAVLALASLARRDLFVGDETKYSQVVREMHLDGAVLVPTLNGQPYTHKPPLHFWLMYVLTAAAGQRTLWPYVLPAMLSGAALVWMIGRIGREWLGDALAWPSRFFLAGLVMAWGLAQTARMDLLFACLTTAGAVGFFRWIDHGSPRDGLTAGFWFGVAGLVKGPAAILILGSLFVFESVSARRRPRLADLGPVAVAIAIPLLWFVPAVLSAGPAYLEEIAMRQTAGRAISSWVHREPFWYYVAASPLIFFPWFGPLIASIRSVRELPGRPEVLRCIRWVLAIVVPFSFISSKLPVYMVPAFPPVALLAAWYVGLEEGDMRWQSFVLWLHRACFLLFCVIPLVLLSGSVPVGEDATSLLEAKSIRVALVLMAIVSLAGLASGWKSVRLGSRILPFAVALPVAILVTAGAPMVNGYASVGPLVDELSRQVSDGDDVRLYYTPHLWSRTLPARLELARQTTAEELAGGARPDVLAVRGDRVDDLGGALGDYFEVSAVRFMGKTFHVYRRR